MPRTKKPKLNHEWTREKRNHGGSIVERNSKIYARRQYVGEDGKIHEQWRLATSRKDAREKLRQMNDELKKGGEALLDAHRMTFAILAREYKQAKLRPAKIENGKKVAGMRSYTSTSSILRALLAQFTRKYLWSIRHSDIEAYKHKRLETPVKCGKDKNGKQLFRQRSITGVNRELELLRAMLRFAVRNEWIIKSPFQDGDLISKVSEHQRERVLTRDEEQRLLDALGDRKVTYTRGAHKRGTAEIPRHEITAKDSGENRAYLRALIITALDTGMRRGELFKLMWSDIHLDANLIRVKASNTKTERSREIGITPRVREQLLALRNREDAPKSNDASVFGVTHSIKYAWATACEQAKLDDLHFHDLRHTFVTRCIRAGAPAAEVMKISGHTQHVTFNRYLNIGPEAALKAAELLSQYQELQRVGPSEQSENVSDAVN